MATYRVRDATMRNNKLGFQQIKEARRLIIKIGSSLLVDEGSGEIRRDWLDALADDIFMCRERGQEVLVVTSGAIAVGRYHLGLHGSTLRLEEKQAAAATGQIRLAHAYQATLARHNLTVAQILLTLSDTEERRRHLNARNTLTQLLQLGAIPVINENDTVATQEIRFGDNDRLAARVAAMISADTLVLLSDIDGLYDADPRQDVQARHIAIVNEITAETEAMAGKPSLGYSSGGMATKLQAAKISLAAGCRMVIALGTEPHPLRLMDEGGRCTWFVPQANPMTARKRWIAGSLQPMGVITIDEGAVNALGRGTSLLPAGITEVKGMFERGDLVSVSASDGREVARGLSAYANRDAVLISGHKSSEIEAILGYRGRDELIHRDDLVLS